ncbi:matrixin family metalloprotease [Methanosarcina sp.]|uniref:matrixin family metalloprotease n=1 Tax=Methanosarcina sp. TaxID=2213 RepID=UPI00399B3C24
MFNSNLGPLWSTSGQALHYDVQSVALHEFGHWLSLGHVNDYDAVMFPTLGVSDVKRSLTSDEIAGIRSIYP